MKHLLRIEEKFSKLWPSITIISLFLALIFFLFFISTDNTLYESYFRLLAFSFLAAGILCIFKLKDGKVILSFELTDNRNLRIDYLTKNNLIKQDQWDLEKVVSVKVAEMPNKSLYNDIVTGDRCVIIRLKNSADWLYLNNLNSRVIPLTETDAEKIRLFIENSLEIKN